MEYGFPLNLTLETPLGSWEPCIAEAWTNNWDWFVTEDKTFLYYRATATVWHRFLKDVRSHKGYKSTYLVVDHPIESVLRATVESGHGGLFLLSTSTKPSIEDSTDSTRMIVESLEIPLPELKWTMDYLHSSDKTDQLLENFNSGTALAVSDGSYYPYEKIGAAAWIITTPDETQWIKGGGIIPGPKEVQSAYRSEVGGLVSIAVCLTSLSSHLSPQLLRHVMDYRR